MQIADIDQWQFFTLPRPRTIAGPCSAESREQVLSTAKQLRLAGINVFRAGIWKPRTHPGCFEGVGEKGLGWLQEAKSLYGLKVCTEVANEKHVAACLKYGIDMVWIGARTTSNPFLVQEIAEALNGSGIPVMVKNPINPDPELWIGAFERLGGQGIVKLAAIFRGFSTLEKIKYRNDPQWQTALDLKKSIPGLSVFCDPSHISGKKEYIAELSQRAVDLGFDGLMVESHCNPFCALSDAAQQLEPCDLSDMLISLNMTSSEGPEAFARDLRQLREHIDVLDEELLRVLAQRLNACREIGRLKRDNGVEVLQPDRRDEMINRAVRDGSLLSLDEEYVRKIFTLIHDLSVNEQKFIGTK